jgi:hypothetical protein
MLFLELYSPLRGFYGYCFLGFCVVVARFQDVLGSNLEKPKNDDTKTKNKTITKTETKTETKIKTENKSASIKINPLVVKQNERSKFENKNATVKTNPSVVKQNDQSKFKEEIKKILKKALISAHKNGKYEVAELTKKNQQSFDEFKNSLIKSQESNNHKRAILFSPVCVFVRFLLSLFSLCQNQCL